MVRINFTVIGIPGNEAQSHAQGWFVSVIEQLLVEVLEALLAMKPPLTAGAVPNNKSF